MFAIFEGDRDRYLYIFGNGVSGLSIEDSYVTRHMYNACIVVNLTKMVIAKNRYGRIGRQVSYDDIERLKRAWFSRHENICEENINWKKEGF